MPGIACGLPSAKENPDAVYYYKKIRVISFRCKHSDDPWPLLKECGEFWFDKVMIECISEHYDWEYECLGGWYFKKLNNSLKQVTEKLWQLRKDHPDIQLLFKLVMNTVWGYSVRKTSKLLTRMIKKENLESYEQVLDRFTGEGESLEAKIQKSFVPGWAMPQFGVNVMSWSKKEMADLIYHCVDNGIQIHYVNTDCMLIAASDLSRIPITIGKDLGEWKIEKEVTKFICVSPKRWFMKLTDGSTDWRYGANDEVYWERLLQENQK